MHGISTFEGNIFAGGLLDRAGNLRRDAAWFDAQMGSARARFLPLWRLKAPLRAAEPERLHWLDRAAADAVLANGAAVVLLGLDDDGVPHFALDASALGAEDAPPFGAAARFEEVRSAAPRIDRHEAALLAQARALIEWHNRTRFCATCGAPTRVSDAGYVRACSDEGCAVQHFPRTDPVVIMLIHRGDACLLGRQKWFPPGLYSTLAGFMEPGESIEEAVRREVAEEAGIAVGTVRYHSSQPWPYPSSLMIGCFGEALSERVTVDGHELDDARWMDRAVVREAVERVARRAADPISNPGSVEGAGEIGLVVPAPMAIAHQLMRAWIA